MRPKNKWEDNIKMSLEDIGCMCTGLSDSEKKR